MADISGPSRFKDRGYLLPGYIAQNFQGGKQISLLPAGNIKYFAKGFGRSGKAFEIRLNHVIDIGKVPALSPIPVYNRSPAIEDSG